MKNIIFDFGAVLIDWNPNKVYSSHFKTDEEMERFYEETQIQVLNKQIDKGVPFDAILNDLSSNFPHHSVPIKLWKTAWHRMIGEPIWGSISLLKELKEKNYPLYGLTNWSSETFPYVYYKYDFFHDFIDIVVSGREKTIKPEEKIYKICLERNNLAPESCIFIDDNKSNVEMAINLGMAGIVFVNPEQLKQSLVELGIDLDTKL
ncbi:MAG: HAD family phosphatase [Pseudomonadota bacterium]